MGLFSKSLEEKKLKELTGGFLLNDKFKNQLDNHEIPLNIGYDIQKTLKEEIKMGRLTVDEIEPRLNYLIKQFAIINYEEEPINNKVQITSPKQRTLKFLINQNHNINTCPYCNAKYLKTDSYCYNCGHEFNLNNEAKENDSKESFKENISKTEDSNFKFAYVLYLDYYNKFNKIIPKKHIEQYNVSLAFLTEKAFNDGYINENLNLNEMTVKDLKDILRKNNLKVSGRKDELIERINSNIDLTNTISTSGLEFIDKNRHVFYYFNNPELKTIISVEEFDNLFSNDKKITKNVVNTKLLGFFTSKEGSYQITYNIEQYKNLQFFLCNFYEKNNEIYFAIDRYLRLFLIDMNNFSEKLKKAEPQYAMINQVLVNKIISLINLYSIDDASLTILFETSYIGIEPFKPEINFDESLTYLIKIINGEDIMRVTNLIRQKYY